MILFFFRLFISFIMNWWFLHFRIDFQFFVMHRLCLLFWIAWKAVAWYCLIDGCIFNWSFIKLMITKGTTLWAWIIYCVSSTAACGSTCDATSKLSSGISQLSKSSHDTNSIVLFSNTADTLESTYIQRYFRFSLTSWRENTSISSLSCTVVKYSFLTII